MSDIRTDTFMLVKACLNGNRPPSAHPNLPISPEALAAEARAATAAGAGALHVHPRDAEGREGLEPSVIAAALGAIRDACPGIPVGVSTGAWIIPDPTQRLNAIRSWAVLPDFASVNLSEEGYEAVIGALVDKGIGVEAGVWSAADAERLTELSVPLLRVLIEPMTQDCADAQRSVDAIEAILDEHLPTVPRLLHGQGACAWPMLRLAARRGYDTRIGFEDTLALPSGDQAESNAALVHAAWREIGNV